MPVNATQFQSVFGQVNKTRLAEIANSSKKFSGLPKGDYTWRFVDADVDSYTIEDTGETWPKLKLTFEVVTASDDPNLVGRKNVEFYRLGPVFDDGSSPDAATIKMMFEKAFQEKFPSGDPADPAVQEAQMNAYMRFCQDGIGTCWKVTRRNGKGDNADKTYTNISNLVDGM